MIPLLTGAQMRELDRSAIEHYGLSGVVLMEHAGRAVAEQAVEMLGEGSARVVVLCGKGNNGGDGFVAARWLARWGADVMVFLLGNLDDVAGDARVNLELDRKLELAVVCLTEADELWPAVESSDLLIDAMLGTGVSGAPRGLVAEVIKLVNLADRPVLSVDLPSGINADTGKAYRPHVQATRTVTFGHWKRGLAVTPGRTAAGQVVLADIGLPGLTTLRPNALAWQLERSDVTDLLPPRRTDAHKGEAGRVLVIGGSPGFAGAAVLAARAAARGGAGLVTLAVPATLAGLVEQATLETMSVGLPADESGFAESAFAALESRLAAADAVAFGPGIGTAPGAARLLREVLQASRAPVVLDADGLNLLAAEPTSAKAPLILTPHPGEMARLLGREVAAVQADRLGAAQEAAKRYGAVVVLKGSGTVIAEPSGRLTVNPTGSPAMASGGMGDALTGLLAALLGQGLKPGAAALAGAWLHGRAGELAAGRAEAGVLASEVIDHLPAARAELRA